VSLLVPLRLGSPVPVCWDLELTKSVTFNAVLRLEGEEIRAETSTGEGSGPWRVRN
jgi:hypothetical protein